jgi:hypothetical protein
MVTGTGTGFRYVAGLSSGSSTTSSGELGSWADEATGNPLTAGLMKPAALGIDSAASLLFITDSNVVRMYDLVAGSVVTVAGGATKSLPGLASNKNPNHWIAPRPNNVYTADTGYTDSVGTSASFNMPQGVVVVPATRLVYIADTGNAVIRSMSY